MAALLLLTPMGAAANVTTISAPFTGGTAVHYRDAIAQGCGAHLAVKVPSTFVMTTGVGTGLASARSVPCAASDSQASYDGIVGVRGLAFAPAIAGTYTVTAHWTVTWNASASMTGKAAAAGAQATVEIWLLVKIYDVTTGKTFAGKTVFIVHKDLAAAGTFQGGLAAAAYSAALTQSLTTTDTYQIYAVLGFDLQAVIPAGSPTGAVTTAAVDLGSSGHGGTLTGITVA